MLLASRHSTITLLSGLHLFRIKHLQHFLQRNEIILQCLTLSTVIQSSSRMKYRKH